MSVGDVDMPAAKLLALRDIEQRGRHVGGGNRPPPWQRLLDVEAIASPPRSGADAWGSNRRPLSVTLPQHDIHAPHIVIGSAEEPLQQLVHAILGNDRGAREHGLRVTDLQTLHLLVLREDVRTPRQISNTTGIPASTVTKLLDRLEAAGYVRLTSNPADRRKTVLKLIPEAIAPLGTLYGHTDEEFDKVSAEFSAEELEMVLRYLDAVSEFCTRSSSEMNV